MCLLSVFPKVVLWAQWSMYMINIHKIPTPQQPLKMYTVKAEMPKISGVSLGNGYLFIFKSKYSVYVFSTFTLCLFFFFSVCKEVSQHYWVPVLLTIWLNLISLINLPLHFLTFSFAICLLMLPHSNSNKRATQSCSYSFTHLNGLTLTLIHFSKFQS